MTKLVNKAIVTVLTLVITLGVFGALENGRAYAATTFKTENAKPASGNIFVSVDGTFSTEATTKIINRINQIRKEACDQGVINPASGKPLTAKDYKPVAWNTELEEYARLRAAEISVNWDHKRPSNVGCFDNKVDFDGYHSAENIAKGFTILNSIEAYYSEKTDWVKKTGKMTGHYTNMINPKNQLVGMAAFKQATGSTYSAMELGVKWGNVSNKYTGFKGAATQIVEVNVAFLVKSLQITGTSSVVVGKKVKLTANANMSGATAKAAITAGATWSSNNTKVATVDANGNVTGKAAGTATIKVVAGSISATYKVTVTKAATTVQTVKATSVKLNVAARTMNVNETYQLTSTVAPTNTTNKGVTYTSSNTKVATVDATGKVTAKAEGTATITVKTNDGSNKSATCTVTVKNVKVTSIKLNATSKSIKVNTSFKLTVTVNPTNATVKKVTYTSSNTKVATVDANGNIKAIGAGTAYITVKTTDGSNRAAICKVTVAK